MHNNHHPKYPISMLCKCHQPLDKAGISTMRKAEGQQKKLWWCAHSNNCCEITRRENVQWETWRRSEWHFEDFLIISSLFSAFNLNSKNI